MNGLHAAIPFALTIAVAPSVVGFRPGITASDRGTAHLAEAERVQNRACPVSASPKALPSADAIVNLAAIASALSVDSTVRPPTDVTFSVRFLKNGQPEWVKPIGAAGSDAHPRLQSIVAAHTRPQAAAKEPWNVRLQVIAGDSVRYVVSRSHACPVEQIRMAASGVGSRIAMASMEDIRELQQGGEARVEVEVGPTGQILDVDLVRSSGSRIQDDLVVQAAREARYHPAVVDGIPIMGRYEYRTRMRTRVTRTRVN